MRRSIVQRTKAVDAALAAAHAKVESHAAALFDARFAFAATLADTTASPFVIEAVRKAHEEARDAYDAAYTAAYDATRRSMA